LLLWPAKSCANAVSFSRYSPDRSVRAVNIQSLDILERLSDLTEMPVSVVDTVLRENVSRVRMAG
jgi:hypothetical protein